MHGGELKKPRKENRQKSEKSLPLNNKTTLKINKTTLEKISKFAAFLTQSIPQHGALRQQRVESLLALEVRAQDWQTTKNLTEKPKEQGSQRKSECQNAGINSVQILGQPPKYAEAGVCPGSQAKNTATIGNTVDGRDGV